MPRSVTGRLTLSICAFAAATHAHPPDFPDDVDSIASFGDWDVRFTDANPYDCLQPPPPGADLDFLPLSVAFDMLSAIAGGADVLPNEPPNFLTAYAELGFGPVLFDLDFSEDVELFAYNCAPGSGVDPDCDTAVAAHDYMAWAATVNCMSGEPRTRFIVGHELFHYIQYGYVGFDLSDWGSTAVEGTARMMEDQVYVDLDAANTFVFADAQRYLADPNRIFWNLGQDLGYQAVLGWKYAAEQFGNVREEPQVGVDFIRRFWERADAAEDDPSTPRVFGETLLEFTGTSLTRGDWLDADLAWFQRFAHTNLVRRYDLTALAPSLQARYSYLDEADGNNTDYGFVDNIITIAPGGGAASGTLTVAPFGATHFTTVSGDCGDGDVFGFRAVNKPEVSFAPTVFPGSVFYGVAGVEGGGTDRVLFITNGASEEFAIATPSDRIIRNGGLLLVTATGGPAGGQADYAFDCGPASMQMLFPKTSPPEDFKAYVGPEGEERQLMLVGLRITGPSALNDPILKGLRREDFEVFVGNLGDEQSRGTVVNAVDVGESWVLTVLPPPRDASQLYDLHVRLGSAIVVSETAAVSYEERIVDEMLVLDTSGSMADPGSNGGEAKLSAAIAAAQLLTLRAGAAGKLGLATFNTNANVDAQLQDVTDTHRESIDQQLSSLSAGGSTSIGGGLDAALNEFINRGSSAQEDWALLLSDGAQNVPPAWVDDINATNNVRDGYLAQGAHVWAWALGDNAPHVLLQDIAEQTNGFFVALDAQPSPAPDAPASPATDPLPTQIADAFLAGNENAEGLVRLWEQRASEGSFEVTLPVEEEGIVDATLAFYWATPGTGVTVGVTSPDGEPLRDGENGVRILMTDRSTVFQIPALAAGTWTLSFSSDAEALDTLSVLAGKDRQGAALRVYFGGVASDEPNQTLLGVRYLYGRSQPIIATFSDRMGPIVGANVTALVEHPDGSFQSLPLFDDGAHGDGQPDDGSYGNRYRRTTGADFLPFGGSDGTYKVTVFVQGENNREASILRYGKRDFVVGEINDPSPDSDGDGLPDRYELEVGCLDPAVPDAERDQDGDRLASIEEWQLGVDPCRIDTDRGGEIDGSEIARGANPLDPRDDALNPPIDPEVVNYQEEHLRGLARVELIPDANLIRYPVDPTWARLHVYRSTSRTGPYERIATIDELRTKRPFYTDSAVVSGVTYWYYLQAEDLSGAISAPSLRFEGTPKADPVPPLGSVLIAGGASFTDTALVDLRLHASSDTVSMRIANTAEDLDGATAQPYTEITPWTLLAGGDGLARVFVRFEDGAGNLSPTHQDEIEVLEPAQAAYIGGQLVVPELDSLAGISIRVTNDPSQSLNFTDANGQFRMLLPPGTWTLTLSRAGFEDLTIGPVTVAPGQTLDLGELTLERISTQVSTAPGPWLWLLGALLATIARWRHGKRPSAHVDPRSISPTMQ